MKAALPDLPDTNSEKEQVFLASRGVLAEYYSLRQQEIRLEKYKLYAPFNGAFTQINRQVGAVANPGATLASIIRTDKLEIVVPMPPEDSKLIKPGDKVKLEGVDENICEGKVSRIADFIDQSTQSVNVYISYIPKNEHAFKVGEFVDITFDISREISGMCLLREALSNNDYVYVVENQKLKRKKVEVIHKLDNKVVVSGLQEGEIVVNESLVDVSEGQKVKIQGTDKMD